MDDMTPVEDVVIEKDVEHKTMDFPDAMREVIKGNHVTRLEWNNTDYVFLKDGFLSIFTKNAFHKLLVSDGDMEGTDWVCLI